MLFCGCTLKPGEPVDTAQLQAHYKHTLEAVFFWEVLRRQQPGSSATTLALSEVRIQLQDAICQLFPEVIP